MCHVADSFYSCIMVCNIHTYLEEISQLCTDAGDYVSFHSVFPCDSELNVECACHMKQTDAAHAAYVVRDWRPNKQTNPIYFYEELWHYYSLNMVHVNIH
jgi:hypothetical protein